MLTRPVLTRNRPEARRLAADAGLALALAGAAWLLYGSVLGLWWTHDDFHHFRFLLTHRPGWYLFDAEGFRDFPAGVFTPLLFLSLDADRRLFGLDPYLFYLHQLLAFALCPAVLYGVLRLWLRRLWAAAGAWVFLTGPVAASLAPLLMVRHYAESILLAAMALGTWAAALRRWPRRRAWGLAALSAALYFAASLAKEIAVPLAALLPLLPEPAGGRPVSLRERLRLALPHAAALGLYLGLRYGVLGTLLGGYGFTVAPSGLPALALAMPGKIAAELMAGRFSWAAAALCAALAMGILALVLRDRRAAALTGLGLLLAVLPVLPVSTRMEPRYAVPAWIALCAAFAAGGSRLGRRTGAVVVLVACAAGLWVNRQDWSHRFARVERMSAENRALLDMKAGDVLRQPLTLAASLKELRWMKENVFHRPTGERWFQDDLYLCAHPEPLGRVWGYDPGERRVVDLTSRIPVLRERHCSSIRSGAPLSASFQVSGDDLFWELGPYQDGTYWFILGHGAEVFEMPRSAGFDAPEVPVLPLRIKYQAPEGWSTYSPELLIEIRDGSSLRWSRPRRSRDMIRTN
ncbi:MAG TPA: hypothetical protein VKK31_31395 [Thermoanaerobaculia bacterium]|nr:hypothetical protein [Thermoanaerobaculia bacterium]